MKLFGFWPLLLSLFLGTATFTFETNPVYAFCYEEAGGTYDINPQLLRAIAIAETGENPYLINHNKNGTIDIGLMQINSFWIPRANLDRTALLSDPCYNVMVGAMILRHCMDMYGYTWKAIGCYNAQSNSKRISYSWKIYSTLNKLKRKSTPFQTKHDTEIKK